MRSITLTRGLLAVALVAGLAGPAAAQSCAPAWLGEADFLYWTAHRSTTPYSGTLTFGADNASFSDVMAETDYEWNGGLRLGLGRRFLGGLDMMVRFTSFQTHGATSLGDPTVDTDVYFVNMADRSLADDVLDHDFDDGLCDFAQEQIDLEHRVYDLEFGRAYQTSRCSVRPFAGFRFAEVRQGSNVLYQNLESGSLDSYLMGSNVDMTGWGLRAGAETNVALGGCGLSLYGRAGVSLMMSRFQVGRSDTAIDASASTTQVRQHTNGYNATVPQLELAVGLQYQHGPFFCATGYEISHWFNLYQQLDVVGQDDVDGKTTPIRADRGDLSLDGLFLRAGFVY